MSLRRFVSACFPSLLLLALVGNSLSLDSGMKTARCSPDMLPSDGDAWTENDNATYPWYPYASYVEDLSFTTSEKYVGSYSLRVNHTSSWTRMRWCLDFGVTDLSSYNALEIWIKPVWEQNIASERTIRVYVEDIFNSDPRYYCKTKPSNNTWSKIYLPLEAFIEGGSPSWTDRKIIHFYVADDVGASDGSIVYLDGIKFLTHRTPTTNSLDEIFLPNFYSFMKRHQEIPGIVFNGTTYTTLLDWANITDGSSMAGSLEAESLGQTIGTLSLCYNLTNNSIYLDDAKTYANWLLSFQNDTYFGGGVAYEYNNATSTWDDLMGTTVNGWCLWGMSNLYEQTNNATYKTFCDDLMDCLVNDAWMWNSTQHMWDSHYDQVSGWTYASVTIWNMETGGATAGLGAYYRFVEANATMESVVNDWYSNKIANTLNELQMGSLSEHTMYNAWGMYECWKAFNNNTYRNEMLDPVPLYYHANAEVSGNGSLYNYCYLSNGDSWDYLAGWAGCVGSPLLMISYDYSTNETAAFKKKAYEKFVLDWVSDAKGDAWAIEFLINDGNPDKSWCPAQIFLHYGLLEYYDHFYSDPYLATTDGEVTSHSYASNQLALTIDGTGTTTNDVYCGNRGEPLAIYTINGTLTWSYSAYTTILTLNVTHESPTRILVYWKFPGDVNDDGIVDIYDLARIGKAYGATSGSSNWDEDCDINGDEIIDIYDLAICGENYGKSQS